MSYEYLSALPIPANVFDNADYFLTNLEFSYYVRLFVSLCKTAGFIPYDITLVRKAMGCTKLDVAEKLLNKLFDLCGIRIIDFEEVPEKYRCLLAINGRYLPAHRQIIFYPEIFSLANAEVERREKFSKLGKLRNSLSSQNSVAEEKEKKSNKRKEKEELNTKPLQKSLQGAIQEPLRGAIQEPLREEHSCQSPVASCPSKALDEERTTTDERRNSSQSPSVSHQLRENCEKLTAVNEAQAKRASEPAAKSKEQSDGGQFSFRDFRDLWNKWAAHFGVPQFQRLHKSLKDKFEKRQRAFKREGAETEEFWINLLSAVAETSGGFYLGKNDGYRHCGTAWVITANWLLYNDEHIERFLNAVA